MCSSDLKTRTDIQNEIDALYMIHSSHIVSMKASTVEDGDQYIAMEFCNAGDLSKTLEAKGGFLEEADARYILIQIVKGIAEMHKLCFIHRDLKIENVLVNIPSLQHKDLFSKTFDLSTYLSGCKIIDNL